LSQSNDVNFSGENWVRFAKADSTNGYIPIEVELRSPISALPPKADLCGALADVSFGPKADISALPP